MSAWSGCLQFCSLQRFQTVDPSYSRGSETSGAAVEVVDHVLDLTLEPVD